ncbi:hypothetical protein F1559_004537 [Cyanidiococcus yangmingshanensis]|uniref:Uncharacterized protein n=1 Tax=Cyanidiococcus yangmingshanensis TaxID=2690220 RepID=A0A7J7ILJ5_9RHOD|nr:hypothetical protein F1559_004537 [Cyanidiococcus yangmingshanensis]
MNKQRFQKELETIAGAVPPQQEYSQKNVGLPGKDAAEVTKSVPTRASEPEANSSTSVAAESMNHSTGTGDESQGEETSDSKPSAAALALDKRRKRRSGRARKKPLWRKSDSAAGNQPVATTLRDTKSLHETSPGELLSSGPSWRPPPLSKRERSENFFFSALNEIRNAEDRTVLFLDVSHCGVSNRKAKTLGMVIGEAARKRQLGGIALDLGRNPLNAGSIAAFVDALLGAHERPDSKALDGLFTVLDFSECDLFDDAKSANTECDHLVATHLLRLLRSPACSALVRCVLDGSRGLSAESAVRLLQAFTEQAPDQTRPGQNEQHEPQSRRRTGRGSSQATLSATTGKAGNSSQSDLGAPRHILQIHNIYPESTIRALWETAQRMEAEAVADSAGTPERSSKGSIRISQEESRLVMTPGCGFWVIHTDMPRLDASSEDVDHGSLVSDAERASRHAESPTRKRLSPAPSSDDEATEPSEERSASIVLQDGAFATANMRSGSSVESKDDDIDQRRNEGVACGNHDEHGRYDELETVEDSEEVYDFQQLFEALEQVQDIDKESAVRLEVNEHLESLVSALDRLLGLEQNTSAGAFEMPYSPLGLGPRNASNLQSIPNRHERSSNGSLNLSAGLAGNLLAEEVSPAVLQPEPCRPRLAYDFESAEHQLPFLLRVLATNLSVLERGIVTLPEPLPRENQMGILIERPASLTRYRYVCLLQRLVQARRAGIDLALISSQVLLFALTMFVDHPWSNCIHAVLLSIVEHASEQDRWLHSAAPNIHKPHPGAQLFSQIWFGDAHALSLPSERSTGDHPEDAKCSVVECSPSPPPPSPPPNDVPRCTVLQAIYRGVCTDAEWCSRQQQHHHDHQPSEDVSSYTLRAANAGHSSGTHALSGVLSGDASRSLLSRMCTSSRPSRQTHIISSF